MEHQGTNYYVFDSTTTSLVSRRLYDKEKEYAVQQIFLKAYRLAIEANSAQQEKSAAIKKTKRRNNKRKATTRTAEQLGNSTAATAPG